MPRCGFAGPYSDRDGARRRAGTPGQTPQGPAIAATGAERTGGPPSRTGIF